MFVPNKPTQLLIKDPVSSRGALSQMKWLRVSGALFLASVAAAHAAAPMVKTQPGFYRMMVGDFEVTALNDGVVAYPTTQVLPTATPQEITNGLAENGLTDPVAMSYNAS